MEAGKPLELRLKLDSEYFTRMFCTVFYELSKLNSIWFCLCNEIFIRFVLHISRQFFIANRKFLCDCVHIIEDGKSECVIF